MYVITFLGLWSVAALLLSKVVYHFLAKRRHAALSRNLGCQSAPAYTPGDSFGIYNLYLMIKAAKKHYFPELMIERMKIVSQRENRLVTTFRTTAAGSVTIFTCEPRNIQAILATQFKDFEFGHVRNESFRPMLGHGIVSALLSGTWLAMPTDAALTQFATDGKQWEHSRAMLRPQFARDQINDLELEETHVQKLFKVLPHSENSGWTDILDIQPLFFRLTIDTATEFLFGESVESQLGAVADLSTNNNALRTIDEKVFSTAFDQAQQYIFRASRMGVAYRLGHNLDSRRTIKIVHKFVDYYVQLALSAESREKVLEEGSGSRKQKYVFLDAISQLTRNPVELRDQLLNILLAGRDTTASLLSWTFLVLSQRPDIFAKLRNAVLNDFGTYENPRNITFATLKDCAYLQYTLNESLRLYAVVPVNERAAAVDTTLPLGGGPDGNSPIFIPKGTQVNYSVHAMHKRKDLWGDDAEEFRPERWESRKHGWEYLPFNGGPRICLGQQFALTEAGYVVVRLLQKFDALEGFADAEIGYRMTLTCAPAHGVKLRFRAAKAQK